MRYLLSCLAFMACVAFVVWLHMPVASIACAMFGVALLPTDRPKPPIGDKPKREKPDA